MKERVAKWDNIKFFLIFCVAAGHYLLRIEELPNAKRLIFFIYLFHMPAFMFLSGLFSNNTIEKKRYDKIFSYLTGFFLLKIVLFFIKLIFNHKISFHLLQMDDISWYLFVLFVFYMITIILRRFPYLAVMCVSVILACAAGYVEEIGTWLSISRILCFYPFFWTGYCMKADRILEVSSMKQVRIFSILYTVLILIIVYLKTDSIWWFRKIAQGKYSYSALQELSQYGVLVRLVWYVEAGLLILALISLMPSFRSFVTTCGSRTLAVYILHYIPMCLFFKTLNGKELVMQHRGSTLLVLIVTMISVLILSWKPFDEIVKRCISIRLPVTKKTSEKRRNE